MEKILFTGIDVDDLLKKIGQIIDGKLSQVSIQNLNENQTKFLSRQEVAKLLKISLPSLNTYSKLGWLQSYKMGNRVLYKQDEVEQALHKVLNQKHRRGTL
jgi:excisionase family DNA binding protein